MKKVFIWLLILIICFLSGCSDTSGKNVEIEKYGTDDTYVCFYTVCPKCNHKSFTGREINKGESYENMTVCDNCGEMFEFSIER
ncbi:MAG: hypothetical protein IKI29_07320 [Clostridia bacterium]|nr:hypothetical protein [Clostridia bacterium]